jgi:hypothetical protein
MRGQRQAIQIECQPPAGMFPQGGSFARCGIGMQQPPHILNARLVGNRATDKRNVRAGNQPAQPIGQMSEIADGDRRKIDVSRAIIAGDCAIRADGFRQALRWRLNESNFIVHFWKPLKGP